MSDVNLQPGNSYTAFVVSEKEGSFQHSVRQLKTGDLPNHDLLIRVCYSSLNYKDMLSATGNRAVTKHYPFTPGIDAAGIVLRSKQPKFKTGDKVIVTSYDLGMNTPGGFGQIISVPSDWVLHLPESLSLKESMMIGTSGLTAAIGIKKIVDQKIYPDDGKVAVSGATGAVGSFAVALFAHLGYQCEAITGKSDQHSFLKHLGADKIIDRNFFYSEDLRPLEKSKWIAAIDTVGGTMLDQLLRQISHNGIVACCGNVLGGRLETSIYPFILRGVSLMGIDSGIALMSDRLKIWNLLSKEWKLPNLPELCEIIELQDLSEQIQLMKKGQITGKLVIRLPGA
jgi:acrylyl-CoA reductase (NADPH)